MLYQKLPLLAFLLVCSFLLRAQQFDHVDKKVRMYPDFLDTVDELSIRIGNDFDSDTEKVRAVYTWIAHNIEYDVNLFRVFQLPQTIEYNSEHDLQWKLKRINDAKVKETLKERKAICRGYALLFKALCDSLNIESYLIRGFSKNDIKTTISSRMYKDHIWNVVLINNEWKLIDVTWAAGYVDVYTSSFVKRFNDRYFFADPNEFIKHHYPKHTQWQLIDKPISLETFFKAPIFFNTYFSQGFSLSNRHSGIIVLKEDAVVLNFETIPKKADLFYSFTNGTTSKRLRYKKQKNGMYAAVIKQMPKIENPKTLTIFSNGFPVINFKVKHGKKTK